MFVSFPMYGASDHADALAVWWRAIAGRLPANLFADIPDAPSAPGATSERWRDPALLLSQTCGAPLVTELDDAVRVIGTPVYDAPNCDGHRYRSAVTVREESGYETLADLAGARAAINEPGSYSGAYALRHALLGIAEPGVSFFSDVIETGAHIESLAAVRDGAADCAAIDCVTLTLARRDRPALLDGLTTLSRTQPVPGLPYITNGGASDDQVAALRAAVAGAVEDPTLASVPRDLLLAGFVPTTRDDYEPVAAAIRSVEEVVL